MQKSKTTSLMGLDAQPDRFPLTQNNKKDQFTFCISFKKANETYVGMDIQFIL